MRTFIHYKPMCKNIIYNVPACLLFATLQLKKQNCRIIAIFDRDFSFYVLPPYKNIVNQNLRLTFNLGSNLHWSGLRIIRNHIWSSQYHLKNKLDLLIINNKMSTFYDLRNQNWQKVFQYLSLQR